MSSASPLRSLHLTPDLVYYGGGPQMLRVLAEYTDPQACRLTLVSLSSADAFTLQKNPEVTIIGLRRVQAPLPIQVAEVVGVLRRERPNVVHAYGAKCSLLATLAGRLLGIPVVLWEICLDLYSGRLLPKLADSLIEPWVSERICNSCATLKSRQHQLLLPAPWARWSVQCRGVPDREAYVEPTRGEIRRQVRAELGLAEHERALITIGGFIAVRDHATTLLALRRLLDQGYPLKLFLIGDGPLRRETLRRVEELDLSAHVVFLGYVKNAAELLPGMDIYVNGAYAEGFGIATVEALLCRVPVVAADAAANSEVVEHGHTGLLVAPRDTEALARAVRRILDDPELARRLTEHGRHAALDLFAPEALAQAHLDICRRLAKPKGAR